MKRKRKGNISSNISILKKFVKDQDTLDILTLYLVYESRCEFEGCEVEQQSDEIAIDVLQWAKSKYNRIKNKLIEIGIIEIQLDTHGTFYYIHVNYLIP